MALRWIKNHGKHYVGTTSGPYTIKVFETMLGHAVYLVTRDGRQVGAGGKSSIDEAKAEAEAVVQRMLRW